MSKPIKIFTRQPFTESDKNQSDIIQSVLNALISYKEEFSLEFLTPTIAENSTTFKKSFEEKNKKPFTPKNFRDYRLAQLNKADVFINIRTNLSESSAFELAYHITAGNNTPIFFAIWDQAPIKTTLLRELDDMTDIEYHVFSKPQEILEPLKSFLYRIAKNNNYDLNKKIG